ncbi:DUF692 family protein [Clostridiaceae bacterium M8S5]|nr:DUF692 family protein [Clostridiaceae bacterium M8S5]
MLIGCNYHEETVRLVKENKIDIDYYKFPALGYQMDVFDSPDLIELKKLANRLKQTKPINLHGLNPSLHNICSKTFIEDLDVDIVRELIDICELKGLSIHLDGSDINDTRAELLERVVNNIRYVKNTFNDLEFFALENIGLLRNPFVYEADFISEIIQQSDADFLLDISHAYVAAKSLKIDIWDYMKVLPLDRVYEIHINGWIEKGSQIMAHTKIHEEGYRLLKQVLDISKPKMITIEYGRHNDRINSGCPVMKKDVINVRAMDEIEEQVIRIRRILECYK